MDANTANKKPKAHWTDEDTRALLKDWEDHLVDLCPGQEKYEGLPRNAGVPACAQGIDKSVKEIKSKIENLANRYRSLIEEAKNQPRSLASDGRCDTPGHSADFGAYTLLDSDLNKILHTELVKMYSVIHIEESKDVAAVPSCWVHGNKVFCPL
ncbi:hypothetical protein MTO96_033913 [Rhipicephalus appendiculatus]